ncbi:hypothetical protein RB596_002717 [Gaeumannomyces avenae]
MDKRRRLHEGGVKKTTTGATKRPSGTHSFRARIECFRPSPPPREPTPLPETTPTEAFFRALERELDARRAAAKHGDVDASAPRNSSSPPLAPANLADVTKLESTYGGRARVLETQSMKKIDEAHAAILAKLNGLKESDKKWVATVREHQKWTVTPLSAIKLDLGPQDQPVRLGNMAKDLDAKLENTMHEMAEQLDGGGGRPSKKVRFAAQAEVDAEIQKVISEARAELKELGDVAIEKADRTEKEIHARWKKERIKIQQSEAEAADTELFG